MAKNEPKTRTLTPEIVAGVDVMIRQSVQTLYATTEFSLEECIAKAAQMVSAGIIEKAETRSTSGVGPRSVTTLPVGSKVIVRRCTGGEFTYGGRPMDRNQVFELTGLRNDDALVRLGYVEALNPSTRLETCGTCGAQFADSSSAAAHHTRRHVPKVERRPVMEGRRPGESKEEYEQREAAWRAAVIADEDAREDREERAENDRAPLYLDQTKASRA